MEKVGIFFGSTTGNCEIVAKLIQKEFGEEYADVHDVAYIEPEIFSQYSSLILGISTWGIGEMQEDWFEFKNKIKNTDLSGKTIAFFGLGDQDTYSDSFVDALGLLYNVIKKQNADVIGFWPTKGYNFDTSKAIVDKKFVGLIIDEDVQGDLTETRVHDWVIQIKKELGFQLRN